SPGWIPISPLPHWIMPCGFIGHSIWMIGYYLSRSHRLRNQRAVWVWAGFIPSTGNWLPPLHKKACSGCHSLVNQQRPHTSGMRALQRSKVSYVSDGGGLLVLHG